MKRIFAIALTLIMLTACTACSNVENNKTNGGTEPDSLTRNGSLCALKAPEGWEMGVTNRLTYVLKNDSLPNGKATLIIRFFDDRSADSMRTVKINACTKDGIHYEEGTLTVGKYEFMTVHTDKGYTYLYTNGEKENTVIYVSVQDGIDLQSKDVQNILSSITVDDH